MSNNVRQLRRSLDLSQEELANRVGMSRQAINKIERGITKRPAVSTAIKISAALGVDVEMVFSGDDVNSSVRKGM